MANGVGDPEEKCPLKKDTPPDDKKKGKVTFQIVDNEGYPLAGVLVKIQLPNTGKAVYDERASNEDGIVEIPDLDPGNCKVIFDWEGHTIQDVVLLQ